MITDWRGKELSMDDFVVAPYAWGGQPLALIEGQIVGLGEDEADVELWYDSGTYPRKREVISIPYERLTKVEER